MKTYLVGGAVRDRLLGYPHHERDWVVVGATPAQLEALGYQRVGKDFPVFLHPQTREEYALARTERKSGHGYHGFECNSSPDVTLEEDLARRDLTINAMAEDELGNLVDPYGGRADLEARCLRHVSPAFAEDPLRVLRVARFAARYAHLGFTVAPETLALMHEMSASGELGHLARERIWVELEKALGERSPQVFFQVMLECGALQAIAPRWAQSINGDLFNALQRASEQQVAVAGRFAVMCSRLGEQDCKTLCRELKAPKNTAQLAQLVCRLSPLPAAPQLRAETVLQLLETLDCLRRPRQLQQFNEVEAALYPGNDALPLLENAAERIRAVSPGELMERGFNGHALGRELRRRRLQAIEELLCQQHQSP